MGADASSLQLCLAAFQRNFSEHIPTVLELEYDLCPRGRWKEIIKKIMCKL